MTNQPNLTAQHAGQAGTVRDLPKSFKRDGFVHAQEFSAHPFYVYRKSREGCPDTFETIKARLRGGCVLNGRVIPARWQYPATARWGIDGFSCQTFSRALERVREISGTIECVTAVHELSAAPGVNGHRQQEEAA
jgi:hypothetical protein